MFFEGTTLTLNNDQATLMRIAIDEFQENLKNRLAKDHFEMNTGYVIVGMLISLCILILQMTSVFKFVLLIIAVIFMMLALLPGRNASLSLPQVTATKAGIWLLIMAVLFMLQGEITWPEIFSLFGLVVTNLVFYHLMKSATLTGREIQDEIEGFRMYLSLGEKEMLEFATPPEKTPELFEKYLPYAIALDVENKWAEKFTDIMAQAAMEKENNQYNRWYSGNRWNNYSLTHFSSSLTDSLSSSIASASTPPGSDSGGGGFSGGGGGGGGGGGW